MQEASSLLRLTLQQAELENSFLRGMFLTLITPLVDLRSPKCLTFYCPTLQDYYSQIEYC